MRNNILYSQCWEDPLILEKALMIVPSDTVLSISSAGDNTLYLLSKSPKEVIAVDINPEQNFLLELKACAIKYLDYADCLGFLGILKNSRRINIYNSLKYYLTEDCRKYWNKHLKLIKTGIIHVGKFERYLALFRKLILPLSHSKKDIDLLLSLKSLKEQNSFYKKKWNNLLWRITFRIFFSKFILKLLGRDDKFFKYNRNKRIANHYLNKTKQGLIKISIKSNYFLYYILKKTYQKDNLPEYLKPNNFKKIKKNLIKLKIITSDLKNYLSHCKSKKFSKFNLSDIFEVYSQKDYETIMQEIVRVSKKGALLCYWNNLVNRTRHKNKNLVALNKKMHSLSKEDRVFFYNKLIIEKLI